MPEGAVLSLCKCLTTEIINAAAVFFHFKNSDGRCIVQLKEEKSLLETTKAI